jgi:O-antigen ligase
MLIILAGAILLTAVISAKWPGFVAAFSLVGVPLILVVQFYARLPGFAVYVQGFFAMYCVLVAWLHRPHLHRLNTPFLWWGLLVLALMALGYSYSTNPDMAWVLIRRFMGVAIPLMMAGALLADSDKGFRGLMVSLTIVVVAAYVTHFIFLTSGRVNLTGLERWSELGSPILQARFSGAGVLVFVYLASARRSRIGLPVWLAGLGAGLLIMILTASRGPLLSLFLAVLFTYALRVKKLMAGMLVGAVVVVTAYVILTQFAPQAVRDRLLVKTTHDPTGTGRMGIYEVALQIALDSPLTGIGTSSFSTQYGTGEESAVHPHNLFLELFVGHGILGLAAAIVLTLMLATYIFRCVKARPVLGARCDFAMSLVIYGFVNAMFSADLGGQDVLYFGAGMLVGLTRLAAQREAEADILWDQDAHDEQLPAVL